MGKQSGIIYKPVDRNEFTFRVTEAKRDNIEEHFIATIRSLRSYAAAVFKFGVDSPEAHAVLRARKELVQVLKEENSLFKFMLKNIYQLNLDKASELVDQLDDLSYETLGYYYSIISDVEFAADYGDVEKYQKTRNSKAFKTLTETSSYRKQVIALAENTRSIMEFLGYPKEFWEFMKGKYSTVEMSHDIADKMPYATYLHDENGVLDDVRVLLPAPTDLYTALIAVQTWEKAYQIYQSIGKTKEELKFDNQAIEEMKLQYRDALDAKANKSLK